MNLKISVGWLKTLSIVYLSLPLFFFFWGWLHTGLAIGLSAALLLALYLYVRNETDNQVENLSLTTLLSIIACISVWVLFSGTGGFGYQNYDYVKHNSLILDLMHKPRPISYVFDGQLYYLAHYLGYYITVPSLVGFMGWKYVQVAQALYTIVGVCLAFFWFLRFLGKFSSALVLFLIFISGCQLFVFIANHYSNISGALNQLIDGNMLLHWINGLSKNGEKVLTINYMNLSEILYWAPQHALPAWLGMGLLLNDFKEHKYKFAPFYLSLLVYWSPLLLIGFLPYLVFIILKNNLQGIFNLSNIIIAPIIFVVVALYITSIDAGSLVHHFIFNDRSAEGISILDQLLALVNFQMFEVLIWWLPSYYILRKNSSATEKQLYILTLVILLLIPLYRYAIWNDWCTRVSLPALVVLYLMAAKALINAIKVQKIILLIIFGLCLLDPLMLMTKSFKYSHYRISFQPAKIENIGNLKQISVGYPVTQFVATPDKTFFKYLAKKNAAAQK